MYGWWFILPSYEGVLFANFAPRSMDGEDWRVAPGDEARFLENYSNFNKHWNQQKNGDGLWDKCHMNCSNCYPLDIIIFSTSMILGRNLDIISTTPPPKTNHGTWKSPFSERKKTVHLNSEPPWRTVQEFFSNFPAWSPYLPKFRSLTANAPPFQKLRTKPQ